MMEMSWSGTLLLHLRYLPIYPLAQPLDEIVEHSIYHNLIMQYHVVIFYHLVSISAARYTMLCIDSRVAPPVGSVPIAQQAEQEVYRHGSD
jgi:hypothetical protein